MTPQLSNQPATSPVGDPAVPEGAKPSNAASFRRALTAAAPIMAGYVVLGLPCGILCAAAGMKAWMVAAMSILFYSGAGQYMIPNMWLAGNPVSAIVASVGLVNTRQMLYGATLSQFCGRAGRGLTVLFGATVTDESFGVNYAKFVEGDWPVKTALYVNLCSQASWIVANTLGAVVGAAVAVPTALASFAMTSLFICLLCMQHMVGGNVVAALAAALGVVACKLAGFGGVAILVGALCGVAAAMGYSALHPTAGTRPGGTEERIEAGGRAGAACDAEPVEGGEPACR